MEFDKSRVYTSLNADELRARDKVICANDMGHLKHYVTSNGAVLELKNILDENNGLRFVAGTGKVLFALAYLIERKENCTNCCNSVCDTKIDISNPSENIIRFICNCNDSLKSKNDLFAVLSKDAKVFKCNNWKPKTVTPKYRPFKDVDELIKIWCDKGGKWKNRKTTMPYIWIQEKGETKASTLITRFNPNPYWNTVAVDGARYNMNDLFEYYEFLDGSPCGVEE